MKKMVLFLFSLLFLVSCQQQTDKQTLVLDWTPNTNHTGFYVALAKGYYEEVGLDLAIIQPPEDSSLPLVASGKASFGVSFQESVGTALTSSTPLPITTIATLVTHNDSGIVSLTKSGIDSPKKLEGKRLATSGSPLSTALMRSFVAEDGGNYDAIDLIYTNVLDIKTALETEVDAVWIYYGWDGIALTEAGYDINYIPLRDIDPTFDFYTPVIIANDTILEQSPDMARNFLSATKKGYQFAMEHPQEAADILLQYAPELDSDMVHASQEYMSTKYAESTWGTIDPTRWNRFYQWMYEQQLLDVDITASDNLGFTNAFLPEGTKNDLS